jgi:hypothetical protein
LILLLHQRGEFAIDFIELLRASTSFHVVDQALIREVAISIDVVPGFAM